MQDDGGSFSHYILDFSMTYDLIFWNLTNRGKAHRTFWPCHSHLTLLASVELRLAQDPRLY
jgi:hypothetical protein